MKYIIIGCGRAGSTLAERLFRSGHEVTVIDVNSQAFSSLPADFRGRTMENNVLEEGVLERAGIAEADGLAAMTNSDVLNAVVGHIAREVYHLSNVVVRNYSPDLRDLHEAFRCQTVSSTAWGAQKVEEMLALPDLQTIFSAGNGELEIYSLFVSADWDGRPLAELTDGIAPLRVAALTRAGRALLPADDEPLATGDVLLVSASFESISRLQARLTTGKKEA